MAYAASLEEALSEADVVFITNPDRAYAGLEPGKLARKPMVIDAWRLLRGTAEAAGDRNYLPLGVAAQDTELVRYLSELWSRDSEIVE